MSSGTQIVPTSPPCQRLCSTVYPAHALLNRFGEQVPPEHRKRYQRPRLGVRERFRISHSSFLRPYILLILSFDQ